MDVKLPWSGRLSRFSPGSDCAVLRQTVNNPCATSKGLFMLPHICNRYICFKHFCRPSFLHASFMLPWICSHQWAVLRSLPHSDVSFKHQLVAVMQRYKVICNRLTHSHSLPSKALAVSTVFLVVVVVVFFFCLLFFSGLCLSLVAC